MGERIGGGTATRSTMENEWRREQIKGNGRTGKE